MFHSICIIQSSCIEDRQVNDKSIPWITHFSSIMNERQDSLGVLDYPTYLWWTLVGCGQCLAYDLAAMLVHIYLMRILIIQSYVMNRTRCFIRYVCTDDCINVGGIWESRTRTMWEKQKLKTAAAKNYLCHYHCPKSHSLSSSAFALSTFVSLLPQLLPQLLHHSALPHCQGRSWCSYNQVK